MKSVINKRWNVLVGVIILLQTLMMIWWGTQKDGIFYDEFSTFMSSAELFDYKNNEIDWRGLKQFVNHIYTSDDFMERLMVKDGGGFIDQPIADQFHALVHFNTYELILNILNSLVQNEFSIWIAVGINVVLFVIVQIVFALLCNEVFCERLATVLAVTFYGISMSAAMPVVYIRFYEFYILFVLVYTLFCIKMLKAEKVGLQFGILLLGSIVSAWFGFVNARYMLVYVAGMSLTFLLSLFIQTKKGKSVFYIGVYGMAGGVYLLLGGYASFVSQYNVGSQSQFYLAVQKLLSGSFADFCYNLKWYAFLLLRDSGTYILIIFIIGVIILCGLTKKLSREKLFFRKKQIELMGAICISILVYVIVIVRISPWVAWRYVSNIQPLLILLGIGVLFLLVENKRVQYAISICLLVWQIVALCDRGPEMSVLSTGASPTIKAEMNDAYGGYDSILFYAGEIGDLWYAAYLWPEDARTYVTTFDDYGLQSDEKEQIIEQDCILVWVSDREAWETEAWPTIKKEGYNNFELVLEEQESHYIVYKCDRQN